MVCVNVAVLGNMDYAKELGKKGTVSDIALYNYKIGEDSLSLLAPARYPEKVQTLGYAVNMCDVVLLVISKLDRETGEIIVACDAAGRKKGFIILQNYLLPEQIKPLLAGTALEGYVFLEDDVNRVREELFKVVPESREGCGMVPIDHHFNVKGIGTVVLGMVRQGVVKKHDVLQVYPLEKTCQVRSIQIHDTDYAESKTGDRVGLALKNVSTEELDRGYVLAPPGSMKIGKAGVELALDFRLSGYFKEGLSGDEVLHVSSGMQFIPCRIKSLERPLKAGESGRAIVALENPMAYYPGERFVVFDVNSPKLRVLGSAVVA
ncbi:MAG: elongation factor Tu [Thermoplasmata archaeon HGW-Thermoplasmata-1]|nr:MAG: elongation factor Tu [Thermoplasmata archaeon HGW-Thermoplasmata-1]